MGGARRAGRTAGEPCYDRRRRMALTDYRAPLDLRLFRLLNQDGGATLDAIMSGLSSRAFGLAFGLGLVVLLVRALRRRAVVPVAALALAVLAADGVGSRVLKPLLGRMRPCYALPPGTFRWVGAAADVGSLPSLHAANTFALALVVSLARPRLAPLAYAGAVAVSLSRVYLGVHWPSDVAAGALWGTCCAALAWAVVSAVARQGARSPRSP